MNGWHLSQNFRSYVHTYIQISRAARAWSKSEEGGLRWDRNVLVPVPVDNRAVSVGVGRLVGGISMTRGREKFFLSRRMILLDSEEGGEKGWAVSQRISSLLLMWDLTSSPLFEVCLIILIGKAFGFLINNLDQDWNCVRGKKSLIWMLYSS